MRQLIAVILFCTGIFCLAQSRAQVPMTGAGLGAPSSGGFTPSCSQSSTFLTAATGVTLTADKTNYDNLICGLVTDSEFSNLDGLYIWAAPTTTNAALINLANPGTFNGTAHGTTSFSAYHGYTGDGSTFYIDSGFNPNSASSPHYVLNSANIGVYVLTSDTAGKSFQAEGADQGGNLDFTPYFFGNASWDINATSATSTTTSNSQGQWVATRTASTTLALYQNGNTTPVGTATTTSTAVPQTNIFFFAGNSSGTAGNFSSIQMSAGFWGSGLTSSDMNKITARVNTYMTAYSINVY